jgi:hypothetical protein
MEATSGDAAPINTYLPHEPIRIQELHVKLYRQGMAPASASPQPPFRDPGETGQEGQATRRDEQDRDGHVRGREEVFGPLSVERHLKQDGRALILYARREPGAMSEQR